MPLLGGSRSQLSPSTTDDTKGDPERSLAFTEPPNPQFMRKPRWLSCSLQSSTQISKPTRPPQRGIGTFAIEPVSTSAKYLRGTSSRTKIAKYSREGTALKLSKVLRLISGMAWLSSGSTNEELIVNMRNGGLIESDVVAEAMKKVDRANYVRSPRYAYDDAPQSIGHGATISAPHMHAHACQYLLPWIHRDAHILDVGSGSGYTAAVFHHLLQSTPASGESLSSSQDTASTSLSASQSYSQTSVQTKGNGLVVGIDHIPALVSWSVSNLQKDGLGPALDSGDILMVAGDGRRAEGGEGGAPYDVIHVGAAAPEMPEKLVEILKSPGRMFIPIGPDGGEQDVWTVDKDAQGKVTKKKLFGVRYVPLTDQARQMGSSRY